ncbi:MAG: NADP-dependent oxidoreductase, partial [Chloroflexia bacterium]|nr:NADP-dependent oxidoreductase [Chloroflexia bacterium]
MQLLVRYGVTVIGTTSEANHDYLCTLDDTVSYGDGVVDRIRAVAPTTLT